MQSLAVILINGWLTAYVIICAERAAAACLCTAVSTRWLARITPQHVDFNNAPVEDRIDDGHSHNRREQEY